MSILHAESWHGRLRRGMYGQQSKSVSSGKSCAPALPLAQTNILRAFRSPRCCGVPRRTYVQPSHAAFFNRALSDQGVSRLCSHVKGSQAAVLDKVDINSRYSVAQSKVQFYQKNGFVKLQNVFDEATLAHYAPAMSLEVKQADKTPMQQDPDYQQAFTQVQNLWRKNEQVFEFVKGHRLAQIAAELMGVEGVRLYADQALYKEPHGGYTPWHCDAAYWPLASDKAVTAWIPLQATPQEMGPMQFAAGSHEHDLGRHLEIGRDAHKLIDAKVKEGNLELVSEPFQFGEVSFHSSLNFHKAEGNQTDQPRQVFTIIFIDKDMKLAEPATIYQARDRDAYFPHLKPGDLCATDLNPIIWSA